VVALRERDLLGAHAALVLQPAEPPGEQLALRDLGDHVHELLLDELVAGDGTVELPPLLAVAERGQVARARRAERAPYDPVARLVETRERPGEPRRLGQDRRPGDAD